MTLHRPPLKDESVIFFRHFHVVRGSITSSVSDEASERPIFLVNSLSHSLTLIFTQKGCLSSQRSGIIIHLQNAVKYCGRKNTNPPGFSSCKSNISYFSGTFYGHRTSNLAKMIDAAGRSPSVRTQYCRTAAANNNQYVSDPAVCLVEHTEYVFRCDEIAPILVTPGYRL